MTHQLIDAVTEQFPEPAADTGDLAQTIGDQPAVRGIVDVRRPGPLWGSLDRQA